MSITDITDKSKNNHKKNKLHNLSNFKQLLMKFLSNYFSPLKILTIKYL